MSRIESALFELASLDTLATRDSFMHRLDPRAKVVTTLVFILCVVSLGKYQLAALLPFFLFPVVVLSVGHIPLGFLLKKLLLIAPFAILIGIFNPIFDRQILLQVGPLGVSGGWVSCVSILLRFALTISAALLLIATTSFNGVCLALEKLGVPRVFTLQLLFLHRYLFVLVDEGRRLVSARALRSFNGKGMELAIFGQLVGQLLLRTLDRAQRIHQAMCCRGFDGEIRLLRRYRFGRAELLFMLGWCGAFLLLRSYNLPRLLGSYFLELFR